VIDNKQTFHRNCLLCSEDNPRSMRLKFNSDGENRVVGKFSGKPSLQGYDGILHGGVIMALLDSAMTNCIFKKDTQALTASMSVKFVKSIPADATIFISAEIEKSNSSLFIVKSKIELNYELMASAEAKFLKIRSSKCE